MTSKILVVCATKVTLNGYECKKLSTIFRTKGPTARSATLTLLHSKLASALSSQTFLGPKARPRVALHRLFSTASSSRNFYRLLLTAFIVWSLHSRVRIFTLTLFHSIYRLVAAFSSQILYIDSFTQHLSSGRCILESEFLH